MIVAGSTNPLLMTSAGGYNLTRSLRFRSSASAYLSRTPATASNRRTWTYSAWVKLGATTDNGVIFEQYSGNSFTSIQYTSSNTLIFWAYVPFGYNYRWTSAAVFRDPSAWYHVVVVCDTTQASTSNAVKLYINGVQQTFTYSVADGGYSQNVEFLINSTGGANIGKYNYGGVYYDGYITEVNFIDGQALTPSSFGQTSSTTGVWQPKRYSGTYGTNGFYLPFTDNSALTTSSNAGLGKDFSGNGNYWTTNNISITAGQTYDSMTDVPTLTSATAANFCTLNPLVAGTTATITNGNLSSTGSTTTFANARASFLLSSGKWYWEQTITGSSTFDIGIGLCTDSSIKSSASNIRQTGWYNIINGSSGDVGTSANGGSNTTVGTTNWATNDVIMVAYDASTGYIWFGRNGTWYPPTNGGSAGNPSAGTNQTISAVSDLIPASWHYNTNAGSAVNFGQRPFAYTPPTGFVALNTYNLPTPTIGATASTQANKYFDATLYTGNGTTNTITNAGGFSPDLVWVKIRSAGYWHFLSDTIRGTGNTLSSNVTDAQYTGQTSITAFNSDGFTLGTDTTSAGFYGWNLNGSTYVGWQWRGSDSTAVTNTAGSITSTVSANTTSGFSVVTYTGNGTAGATVGHGLGVAPKMIIIKSRSSGGTVWPVYHASIGNTGSVWLNSTNATDTGSYYWNNTTPTSTVFTLGNDGALNDSGATYVAYCFAEVAGFSKFGSYTGNGSADGTFVYTGFRPKYVMVKCSSSGQGGNADWRIQDSARDPSNLVGNLLFADVSNAESSGNTLMDFTSNGFKLRGTSSGQNANGATYIYMAFAEFPFRYSLAR